MKRLDHFFNAGYYLAGNEPSFQTPIGYHYANQPTKSVDRVRDVVFTNFDISKHPLPPPAPSIANLPVAAAGLPGNDDQAAMATLLVFHILGLYPVPSTSQFLILSPMTPQFTIHNSYLNVSTTVTARGFDAKSVQQTIPKGAAAYVANVTVNGVVQPNRCHFDFYDVFRVGGEVVLDLTADKDAANSCGAGLPESVSTGGFASAR